VIRDHRAVLLAVLLILGVTTSTAWAQETTQLETMTVTANKTDEDVQEVSASITAISGDTVTDLGMDSIYDVASFTPNFMLFENGVAGANAPSMRGMYADIHSHSVAAGMYIDGVPILDGMGYDLELLDVERIEVLKGPQGTLYGKSTEAGVVNVITRQPDDDFTTAISGQLGLDNKRKAVLSASGPILKDKLYFGISALHDQKDGWVERVGSDSTIDDTERNYGNAKLRLTPSPALDITLKGAYLKYDNGQPHMNLTADGAGMYGLDPPADRQTDPSFEGYDKRETYSGSLNVAWDLTPDLHLTATTAYRKIDWDGGMDYDFSPPELLHFINNNRMSTLSQEIRIDAAWPSVTWVAGVYGDKDKVVSDYRIESMIPEMATSVNDDQLKGTSGSAFAHINVPIGDRLAVLGGLRYDYQEKTFDSADQGIALEDDWHQLSPKIGAEYRLTSSSKAYATVAKGYLSGGFNAYAYEPEYITYDEEKLWSYEIGVKNTFFDNRLMFNTALFHMDIDDAQVHEMIDAARSYTTNAAKATSQGVELEMAAVPVRGLKLFAGVGYSKAEFDEFKDAAGDYQGNKKPYAPEYTFNIGVQYRSLFGFYWAANMTGYGDMYTDKANTDKRDAYELVNLKIGYEADHFDVYLYGENIFDETYDTVFEDGFYVVYSEPARAGVQVTYRF
jgi:iron complex outermembrane receptor protein